MAIASRVRARATYLSGRQLMAARIIWVAFTLLILSVFAIALPAHMRQMEGDPYQFKPILDQVGLNVEFLALYTAFFNAVLAISCLTVALLIFWRKSDSLFELLVSLGLLSFITYSPVVPDLGKAFPQWQLPLTLLRFGGALIFLVVFYQFPDGRFIPRWTKYIWLLWATVVISFVLFSKITPESAPIDIKTKEQGNILLVAMAIISTGVFAQIYRYRRVSNAVQRQQTKWAVLGFIVMFIGLSSSSIPALIFPELRSPGLSSFIYVMIDIPVSVLSLVMMPVTLAISILKYRLWDIDVIIRRTLVYGVLTLMVAAIYFGGVLLLQTLIQGTLHQSQSPFAILITTLGIASIFTPLRRRIQMDIDRRFYRQKYDADKMLRAFAQRVRDDVDLENIQHDLIRVVNETLHPGTLGIWVRESADKYEHFPQIKSSNLQ